MCGVLGKTVPFIWWEIATLSLCICPAVFKGFLWTLSNLILILAVCVCVCVGKGMLAIEIKSPNSLKG
jgi:hypothetical protein